MIQTPFGDFDGKSWERLCQAAFRIKYGDDYQHMPASPGDFGIEGWTGSGLVFQCYCPEKHYTQEELCDAIQDKITRDIAKLKKYEAELVKRLGSVKIRRWMFVTPLIEHNKLHAHARAKESEARSWNLPILEDDFSIFLQDGDHYVNEFEQHRHLVGTVIPLGLGVADNDVLLNVPEEFEELIDRKNRVRLRDKAGQASFSAQLQQINAITTQKFLKCDAHLAEIENSSPQVYRRVLRIIGLYAEEMKELKFVWSGEPNELVTKVKEELGLRLETELASVMAFSDARHTADLMVSRWLAVCQLDFTE